MVKTNINITSGQNFKELIYFRKKGVDPLVLKYLYNRGITKREDIEMYLYGDIHNLHDPSLIRGMYELYLAVKEAIENQSTIYIYGDYDCDGVTSTCILSETLSDLGANVNFRLPDRKKDGYGVNVNAIHELKQKGCEILITVDNGIKAFEAIATAKEYGIKTIVLDHHTLDEKVPDGDIVIDLHDKTQPYPYDDLAGCGLAFKVACYLYDMYGRKDEGLKHIDIACIGTIADVVPLTGENRIIVKEGLKYINRADYNRASVNSIIETMSIAKGRLVSMDVGFSIGPIINAPGRIEEDGASIALRLLLCKDYKECLIRAKKLKDINDKRKEISNSSFLIAKKIVEENYQNDKIIIVYLPNVEEGVVGLISGKITQHFNKPSVVFTDNGKGGYKASGRSIPIFDLEKGLVHCRDILGDKWGGHPMACGVSVDTMEQINDFREKINSYVENVLKLTDKDFEKTVNIDLIISENQLESLKESINLIQPCGQDNPHPIFLIKNFKAIEVPDRNKMLLHYFIMGKEQTHVKIHGAHGSVVAFGMAEEYAKLNYPKEFDVAFNFGINFFRGEELIQLQCIHMDI